MRHAWIRRYQTELARYRALRDATRHEAVTTVEIESLPNSAVDA
jgi:hypothetical protein